MDKEQFNQGLLEFLSQSTSSFHAVRTMSRRLMEAGFTPFDAQSDLSPGSGGVFYEQAGTLIALRPGSAPLIDSGVRMVGAHTDRPTAACFPLMLPVWCPARVLR